MDARADGDVVDREVIEIQQLIAAVLGDEILEAHERAVHAEPYKIPRLHPARARHRLEVLQVTDQFKRLIRGRKRVAEQVTGYQVSQGDAVKPVPQGVLAAAHSRRDLGPYVPETRVEVAQEPLVHRQHLP